MINKPCSIAGRGRVFQTTEKAKARAKTSKTLKKNGLCMGRGSTV